MIKDPFKVILISGKKGVGKDEAARYLVNSHGFAKISFADFLRECGALIIHTIAGTPVEPIKEFLDPVLKEEDIGLDFTKESIRPLLENDFLSEFCFMMIDRIEGVVNIRDCLEEDSRVIITSVDDGQPYLFSTERNLQFTLTVGQFKSTMAKILSMLPDLAMERNGNCRMTRRQLLQWFGTEGCRNNIHIDIWTIPVKKFIREVFGTFRGVVVPDFRFPNEGDAIGHYCLRYGKQVEFLTMAILRPGHNGDGHISENALNNYEFDILLNNDEGLDKFIMKMNKIPTGEWKLDVFNHEIAERRKTNFLNKYEP